MHDTYTLPNGDVYNDVVELEVFNMTAYNGSGYTHYEYMYYAKEIGLIRYLKPESETTGSKEDVYVVDY